VVGWATPRRKRARTPREMQRTCRRRVDGVHASFVDGYDGEVDAQ
jgi:hypothetical protein